MEALSTEVSGLFETGISNLNQQCNLLAMQPTMAANHRLFDLYEPALSPSFPDTTAIQR